MGDLEIKLMSAVMLAGIFFMIAVVSEVRRNDG